MSEQKKLEREHFGDPIRQDNEGFKEERVAYLNAIDQCPKDLPSELEHLRHSIDWPVDMSNPECHVTGLFRRAHFATPDLDDVRFPHNGVDAQLPKGTEIVSPADNVTVLYAHCDEPERGLVDVILYSKELGMFFILAHVDLASLPEKIANVDHYDKDSNVTLKKGEKIGQVGTFFTEYTKSKGAADLESKVMILEDVEKIYGRSHDHVHIEIHYYPQKSDLPDELNLKNPVDPLLLLKRLYS